MERRTDEFTDDQMTHTVGSVSGVSQSSPSLQGVTSASAAVSVPAAAAASTSVGSQSANSGSGGTVTGTTTTRRSHRQRVGTRTRSPVWEDNYQEAEDEDDRNESGDVEYRPVASRSAPTRRSRGRDAAPVDASLSVTPPPPLLDPLTVPSVAASPPTHEAARALSEAGFDAVLQTRDSLRELLSTHARYADEYAILEPLLLSKLVVYTVDRDRRKAFFKAHPVLKIDGEPAPGLHLWQTGSQINCSYTTLFTCNTCTNRVPAQKDTVIGSIVSDHGTEAQKLALKALLVKKSSSVAFDDAKEEKLHRGTDSKLKPLKRRHADVAAEESSDEAAAASTSSKYRRTSNEKQQAAPPHDDDDDDEEDQDRDEVDEDGEGDDKAEDDPTSRLALAAQRRKGAVRAASPPTHEAARKLEEVGFTAATQTRDSLRKLIAAYAAHPIEYAILEPLLLSRLVVYKVDRARRDAFRRRVDDDHAFAATVHKWQSATQANNLTTIYTCNTCTERVPAQKSIAIEWIVADHGSDAQKQAFRVIRARKKIKHDERKERKIIKAREARRARRKRRRESSAVDENGAESVSASTSSKYRRTNGEEQQAPPPRPDDGDDHDDQSDEGNEDQDHDQAGADGIVHAADAAEDDDQVEDGGDDMDDQDDIDADPTDRSALDDKKPSAAASLASGDNEPNQDDDEIDEDGGEEEEGEDGEDDETDPTDRFALATHRRNGGYLFDAVWYRLTADRLGPRRELTELRRRGYMRLKATMADLIGAPDAERILPFLTKMTKQHDDSAATPQALDESNSFALSPAEVDDAGTLYGCQACSLVASEMSAQLVRTLTSPHVVDCVYFQPMSSSLLNHIRRDHAHLTPPKTVSRELERRLDHCKQELLDVFMQPQARHFDHAMCEADFNGLDLSAAKKSVALKEYLTTLKNEYQSEPIDLLIVLQRVLLRCYSSVDDVVVDAQRIFDSAKQYNEDGSAISQAAVELEAELMPKLEEIAQQGDEEEECEEPKPSVVEVKVRELAATAPAAASAAISPEAVDETKEPIGMQIDFPPSTSSAASSGPPAAAASPAPPVPVPVDDTHPLAATTTPLVDRVNSEVTQCIHDEREQCAAEIRALRDAHAAETHALREEMRARDETIRELRESHEVERLKLTQTLDGFEHANAYLHTRLAEVTSKLAAATTAANCKPDERKENGADDAPRIE